VVVSLKLLQAEKTAQPVVWQLVVAKLSEAQTSENRLKPVTFQKKLKTGNPRAGKSRQ
jgi:hypothetical protein